VEAAPVYVVPTGWATLGNITLGNVTLGIVTLGISTFGEVVVDQIVEAANVATTGTLCTGETSGTLGVVVDIIDVDNDEGGGNFGNGLLRTACEALLFLGDERVIFAGTFCVIFLIFVGAGTAEALADATLVRFILFAVVFLSLRIGCQYWYPSALVLVSV
jgi:hypothetical protein